MNDFKLDLTNFQSSRILLTLTSKNYCFFCLLSGRQLPDKKVASESFDSLESINYLPVRYLLLEHVGR